MNLIDVNSWGSFIVGELFSLERGKCQKTIGLTEGDIPYVGCTNVNNGVMAFYDVPKEKLSKGNCICFIGNGDGSAGQQIYKKDDFLCSSGNVCGYADFLTPNVAHFIVSVLDAQQAATHKFSHSNGRTLNKLSQQEIILPIKEDKTPDWQYMEEYMKNIESEVTSKIDKFQMILGNEKHKIDTQKWGVYRLGDLFDFYLSKDDFQPRNIVYGSTPLISAGKENNGIVSYVKDDLAKKWGGGSITVDMFGKVFYQSKPFFCVSHGRVNILMPKKPMSSNVGLYLACVIETVTSKKYQFSEMCTGRKLREDIIKLPIDDNGNPNWDYMEKYMKKLNLKFFQKAKNFN